MERRIFSTFKEASNFAKQQAQAIGATVKLERDGDGWLVFPKQSITSPATRKKEHHRAPESNSWHDQDKDGLKHLFEEQCKEEEEKKRREIKRKAEEAKAREREERQAYLAERKEYYYRLSKNELVNLWNRRDDTNLESDELFILRTAVRKAKGIEPAYHHNVRVCPFCGMVGGNCSCGCS